MKTTPGTLSATGSSNAVTHLPQPSDARGVLSVSGTFTGAVLVVEKKMQGGGTVWLPVALTENTALTRSSTGAPTDSTTTSWSFDASGAQSVRVYASSGTLTSVTVQVSTGTTDEFGGPLPVQTTSVAGASTFGAALTSSGATGGVGYSTGAGGTVTQATNRTTGVTINKVCGAITLVSAAGSTTPATFTVTNSAVAATDVVHVCQKSGTDKYDLSVSAVAAGSFDITFNTKSGTTTEQPVLNFVVLKAVTA